MTKRDWLTLTILLTVIGVMVSCSTFRPGRRSVRGPAGPSGPRIDHALHLDEDMECKDCHIPDPVTGEPGQPTFDTCNDCHEDDDEGPEEMLVKNRFFTPEKQPRWTRALGQYADEIRFAHKAHTNTLDCSLCHGSMRSEARRTGTMYTMEQCMDCHRQSRIRPMACAACHNEIREDVAPRDHRHQWGQEHGRIMRSRGERDDRRCLLCHDSPSWCEKCHLDEQPRSHTNLFRTRTHGLIASMDRNKCMMCHRTDFCVRCHEYTSPRSHRGRWARGINTHCVGCHFPVGAPDQSCGVCHKTHPTHDSAPAQPAWHNPAMNCRGCHLPPLAPGAPPIGHFDNGQNCNFCHQ